MKLPDPKSAGYTPTPVGQHMAVCTRIIDLGTQETQTQYGTKRQHKITIAWELPAVRVEWEKDNVKQEGPALHMERFTFSTHENAELRKKLEMWRGIPFQDSDFGNSPTAFDVRKLLGVGALLQIAHKTEGGKTYANLQAIMLPPGGKASWPKPEGELIFLSLDPEEFDATVFSNLTERMRETIAKSPEYQAMFAPSGEQSQGRTMDDLDDTDIPF